MVKNIEKWDGELNHLSVFVLPSGCKSQNACVSVLDLFEFWQKRCGVSIGSPQCDWQKHCGVSTGSPQCDWQKHCGVSTGSPQCDWQKHCGVSTGSPQCDRLEAGEWHWLFSWPVNANCFPYLRHCFCSHTLGNFWETGVGCLGAFWNSWINWTELNWADHTKSHACWRFSWQLGCLDSSGPIILFCLFFEWQTHWNAYWWYVLFL